MKDVQRFYDLDTKSQPLKNFAEQRLIDLVRQKKPQSLLEVGCGDGHLLELFPDMRTVGIDNNQDMLELAKRRDVNAYFYDMTDPLLRQLGRFDMVISNYAFTELTTTQLEKVFSHLSSMSDGLCFTITNPLERHRMKFPGYRLCFDKPFDYAAHNAPFRVELEDGFDNYTDVGIRDFHQPIELYRNLLQNAGYHFKQQEIYADLDYPYALLFDAVID